MSDKLDKEVIVAFSVTWKEAAFIVQALADKANGYTWPTDRQLALTIAENVQRRLEMA